MLNPRTFALTGTLTVLAFTACQSDTPRGQRGGGTGDAPMTATGELAIANPKPMDAQTTFFTGQIGVEVMLAKSDALWKSATAGDNTNGSGGGGRGGGFGGGGRRGGGGGGRRGGGGDTPAQNDSDTIPRTAKIPTSNAPPIQLRLRLTNHSDAPVDVEALDFNSELGNFAVQPAKITVPPHESVEADPMTSRLGVPAVEEIPITVRLRLGGKTGKTETQIVKLKPRSEDPAPPK
jgi:hypothetical protein